MSFYQGKNVLVTGGNGFVGSHLVERLLELGANVSAVSRNPDDIPFLSAVKGKIKLLKGDLTKMDDCLEMTKGQDFVFHLAGYVRGVGYNKNHPAEMFTQNIIMNTNILEAARLSNVERYMFTSSACGYPLNAKIPLVEEDFFDGEMESTNATYGWAKRMGEVQAEAYVQQYNMKIAIVRPFNLYGPRDNFNLEECHVIPALIRKAVERQKPFILWGDGTPTRVFVYVTDVVEGLLLAMEKHCNAVPINLGSDEEVTMRELAEIILEESGYTDVDMQFDPSKPGGQPRRCASIVKAKEKIGFEPKVGLREGLKRTINWYKENKGLYK